MRLLLRCAALCCAFIGLSAQAHPFTVIDLLKVDRRDEVGISPDGRWLIISVVRGQAQAPRFDYDATYPFAARRLYRADLTHPGPATPLLVAEDSAGYTAGPFSPDGRRLLVSRLRGHEWETGVVEVATGAVRWLGVGIEFPLFGRGAQWRSNQQIVAIVTKASDPHVLFRRGWQRSEFIAGARRITAETGGPSVLAIGSGRYLDRGAKGPQKTLARIDVETGSVTALATGEFIDLEVSQSGRYVAAYKYGADLQPRSGEVIRGGTAERRRDLVIADLDGGAVVPGCGDCDVTPFLMSWGPSADRLIVYARKPGQTFAEGHLLVMTPSRSGLDVQAITDIRPVIDTTSEGLEVINAGWVGSRPAVRGRRSQDSETAPATWLLAGGKTPSRLFPASLGEPSKIVADAKGRAVVLAGGKAWQVQGGRGVVIGEAAMAPSTPLGETGRPTMMRLVSGTEILGRRAGRLVRLDARGEHDLAATDSRTILASSTGVIVTAARDAHGVETISIQQGGVATPVLTLNAQLAEVEFGQVRPVRHKGPGGEDLTSWVVLPADWNSASPPPLVILPYPGRVYSSATPPDTARPGTGLLNVSAQVLAGHGYAVLYPSMPRGLYPDDPAKDLAAQMLTIADAVGAAGLADSHRVAVWGHSFGGHAALAAATQSDRFKAIISTSGVADLVSAWGTYVVQTTPDEGLAFTSRGGYVETGQMRVGGPPWAIPEGYVRNSPLFHADRITAPVLLAYGDLDEYSDGQGGEMFAALYRQGKDAKLLTFWGEGHVINAPGNVRRLYEEALGWLDQALVTRPSVEPGQP